MQNMQKWRGKKVEYEKLYLENVRLQMEIPKYEKMKILSQMEWFIKMFEWKYPFVDHVTGLMCTCLQYI